MKKLVLTLMLSSAAMAQYDAEVDIVKKAPVSANLLVATFDNDNGISQAISEGFFDISAQKSPIGASNSAQVAAERVKWQQTGAQYVVAGQMRTQGAQIAIDYELIDARTGQSIGGRKTQLADTDSQSLRYAGFVIADKISSQIMHRPSDFDGKIAYIEEMGQGANKVSELKVMQADGTNMRVLARVQGSMFSPAWSADGTRIAYTVQKPKGLPVVYVLNLASGQAQLLTPFKAQNIGASFSPDGTNILFSSNLDGEQAIYQMSLGGAPKKITQQKGAEMQPSYHPSGAWFAFMADNGASSTRLYRYHLGTGQVSALTHGAGANPQISPDGNYIGYLAGRQAAVMNANGGNARILGETGIDESVGFSPSSERAIFAKKQGTASINIYHLQSGRSISKPMKGLVRSPVWTAR